MRRQDAPWEHVLSLFGGRWRLLAGFAVTYALAVWVGYECRVNPINPAVIWPAAGVLFSALWLCQRRFWVWLLLVQAGVDVLASAVFLETFALRTAVLYAVSNGLGGAIGATLARALVSRSLEIRTKRTLQLLLATGLGALAGSLPGVWANYRHFDSPLGFLEQLQVWSAGNWLGVVTLVPVINSWLVPLRLRHPELALKSRLELLVLGALLLGMTYYSFGVDRGATTSLLQLPFVTLALILYVAYRLPPRWVATLAMLTVLLSVALASGQRGPFTMAGPFLGSLLLQGFLSSMVVVAYVMSTSLSEIRIAMGQLGASESRYRSLVELSTEAVWRVELDQPMPVSLGVAEQVIWLREHARVAECNRTYLQLDPTASVPGNGHWQRQIPWSAAYEEHLGEAIGKGYAIDGLRFSVPLQGRACTFLTSFSGVVEDGHLHRIWGVARDITELTELNARLVREQERLKTYARQIVTAEENARRATAVDLHDGIGQSLVGMAMTLDVARQQAPPDVRLLIDEVRARLRDVQERTRHMISDLSPPGLYDLGLVPALQWLAVYVRGHDRLHVELDARVREESVRLETRVLVFKLVRELLRNVVKHAGVNAARVTVRGDAEQLQVEVADHGKGFEWQMDMFGARSGGFGLWSIADRVHEAGGQFRVDTAPGRGARFEMAFPLRPVAVPDAAAASRPPIAATGSEP